MTTLQEQFEKDFPDKNVEEIEGNGKYENSNFTNWDLDLSEYRKLTEIGLSHLNITSINLSEQKNLTQISLNSNNLTSVEFLNQLPNPEKLKSLTIYNNNIQPTDISVFSKFVNLSNLKIGVMIFVPKDKRNKFYGSFKSWKNLTKLGNICIEATDVNEGLEYLPMILAKNTAALSKKNNGYILIECSPRHHTNAKCSAIQDQLRPFNYDLLAWQLAHPEKMLISRPEYFTNPDSKDKWIEALNKKLSENRTQTDLTMEQIKTQGQENEQLKEQIKQLEKEKNNKTWYQKVIEKFGKK